MWRMRSLNVIDYAQAFPSSDAGDNPRRSKRRDPPVGNGRGYLFLRATPPTDFYVVISGDVEIVFTSDGARPPGREALSRPLREETSLLSGSGSSCRRRVVRPASSSCRWNPASGAPDRESPRLGDMILAAFIAPPGRLQSPPLRRRPCHRVVCSRRTRWRIASFLARSLPHPRPPPPSGWTPNRVCGV